MVCLFRAACSLLDDNSVNSCRSRVCQDVRMSGRSRLVSVRSPIGRAAASVEQRSLLWVADKTLHVEEACFETLEGPGSWLDAGGSGRFLHCMPPLSVPFGPRVSSALWRRRRVGVVPPHVEVLVSKVNT